MDVNAELAAKSAVAIAAGDAGRTLGLACDVTKYDQCEAVVKASVEKFGKIDILVNNAGITKDNLMMRMSEADWDLVLNVNLKGGFNFIKASIRMMMKAHYGRIVNIASVIGQEGNAGQANYSASKGGSDFSDEIGCARVRLPQHHGECGRTRLHQDADDGCRPRGNEGEAP